MHIYKLDTLFFITNRYWPCVLYARCWIAVHVWVHLLSTHWNNAICTQFQYTGTSNACECASVLIYVPADVEGANAYPSGISYTDVWAKKIYMHLKHTRTGDFETARSSWPLGKLCEWAPRYRLYGESKEGQRRTGSSSHHSYPSCTTWYVYFNV